MRTTTMLMLGAAVLLSLAGCGSHPAPPPTDTAGDPAAAKVFVPAPVPPRALLQDRP